MKTPNLDYRWLIWVVVTLFLVGCGPDAADLALTVESQVAAAVMATQEAWPTSTAQSTFTPYPTFTPQATFTPYPTLTPYPTQTLLPTYTPLPTETAVPPTETPTATPTANPVAPAAPTSASTSVNPSSDREQLINSLAAVLDQLNVYIYEINAKPINCRPLLGCEGFDQSANCTNLVSAYDGIVNGRPVGFTTADLQLQAIYATFGQEIDKFAVANEGWASGCREALAAGETKKFVPEAQAGMLLITINDIMSTLNRLFNDLHQP